MRVQITTSTFGDADRRPLEILADAGIEVALNPFGRRLTESEVTDALRDTDGLIAGLEPLTAAVFEASPRLKAIARVGIGMTNVDAAAAARNGIKVSNTPDAPARAVAEMTVAAMLSLCRRLPESNDHLHRRQWKKFLGTGLEGSSVFLIGCGRAGRRVAELLQPFGAAVSTFDPNVAADQLPPGVTAVSLEDGLAGADVVSLHASGDRVLLGETELQSLKRGAILLNSARGELVDETALLRALDDGTVAGAWFDAFWNEPYDGPLCDRPQVLLTPHAATYSRQCRSEMETQAVRNLLRDLGVK